MLAVGVCGPARRRRREGSRPSVGVAGVAVCVRGVRVSVVGGRGMVAARNEVVEAVIETAREGIHPGGCWGRRRWAWARGEGGRGVRGRVRSRASNVGVAGGRVAPRTGESHRHFHARLESQWQSLGGGGRAGSLGRAFGRVCGSPRRAEMGVRACERARGHRTAEAKTQRRGVGAPGVLASEAHTLN